MTGCYDSDLSTWARNRQNEKFRITSVGDGEYTMESLKRSSPPPVAVFRNAAPDELKFIGDIFGFPTHEGIVVKFFNKDGDSSTQKPCGLYRTHINGQAVIFGYFFWSGGIVKKFHVRSC